MDFAWHPPWGERPLRPSRDQFDFSVNDSVIEFIESAGLEVRGHPLLWAHWPPGSDTTLPAWLTQGNWTRDEVVQILREHILTVVGRYRGRVKSWAVVNEPVNSDGLLDNFWLRKIGPEYIELAFRFAHEADPDALLYLNDDGGEAVNVISDNLHDFVKQLVGRGVPIHGVGLEMHVDLEYRSLGGNRVTSPASARANMERFAALGLRVEITEMDVRIPLPATTADLATQARIYGEMLDACLAVPACTGFTTWGHSDKYSRISRDFPGLGAALPLDADFQPKPAYFALRDRLTRAPPEALEYYNASLDRYFISASLPDIDALDSGRTPGWTRTGRSFKVFRDASSAPPAASPVCRFDIPPGLGDSHFYSVSPTECEEVKTKLPGLVFKSPDVMRVYLPDAVTGGCPSNTTPVYRLWNQRADSNHRHTVDLTLRNQMVSRGYFPEGAGALGIVVCAPH